MPAEKAPDRFWAWAAAALGTLLTTIGVAAYTSARSDVRAFDSELRRVGERTGILEQSHKDSSRRLERIEEKLDTLLGKRL
jgi:hypothetical protein